MILTVNLFDRESLDWHNVLREECLRIPEKITLREKEIMNEMLHDKSAATIAKEKKISFYTVRAHWRNILQKTNCKNQKELTHLAHKEGWI